MHSNTRLVSLEETGWARLLFALLSQRFSGRAEVDQEGISRSIVFQGGFAVWTDFEAPGTGISAILSGAGLLDASEVRELLERAPDDSLGLLQVTDGLESVDDESIVLALRDQCEQRLVAMGGLVGELTLLDEPGVDEVVLERLEPARTLRVINGAVRGHCSPTLAEQHLEHLAGVDLEIGSAYYKYGERFGFDEFELATLRLLGGRASFTIEDLLHISGLDAVRGIQVLYTLWCCNMLVEAGSEPQASAEDVSGGHSESSLVQDLILAKLEAGAAPYDVLGLRADATLAVIDVRLEELGRKVAGQNLDDALEEVKLGAYARREMSARSVARKAVSDGKWTRATDALGDVAAIAPDDVSIALDLAWARWNAVERRGETEARDLDDAVGVCADEEPEVRARAAFYRGHLRKQQGRKKEALAAFQRASKLDERLLDAQREARAIASGAGDEAKSAPMKSRKKSPAARPQVRAVGKARSRYWSGPWPLIWIASGILLTVMLAAQILLRLDTEL